MIKKILSVVGARPQFVKLAPLARLLEVEFQSIILHTGQHFDGNMSELFFNELSISKPDYNLKIHGGGHGFQTGNMLIEIEEVVLKAMPDIVVVFGDTNSTLAGSLVAAKLQIPSIHIEAGLRSFNRSMPEEINRIVSDHVSSYLFAPTHTACTNLLNEGLGQKTYFTGDIMVDSLKIPLKQTLNSRLMELYGLKKRSFSLVTLHRPYNVDSPVKLKNIITNLGLLPTTILFPVHPRTRNVISENKIEIPKNIIVCDPLGYLDFFTALINSERVITDSGGVQKEAYIMSIPCVTLRSETEWVETVESGWNLLLNPSESTNLAEKIITFHPPQEHQPLFGENVAEKMFSEVKRILQ